MGPNTSVAATGIGGAVATLIAYIAHLCGGVIPQTVSAAIATLCAIALGWLLPPGKGKG